MDNSNIEFIDIFKITLIKQKINEDLKQLFDYCLFLKNNSLGRNISNRGGWQSNDLDKTNFVVNKIVREINLKLSDISDIYLLNKKIEIDNIWCNFNGHKDSNVEHIHGNSILSGVFYLSCPDENSFLTFIRDTYIEYHLKETDLKNYTNITNTIFNLAPEENFIYFFPSWLKHRVESNMSEMERVSISFNTWWKK
jgi:uncharacterized protein (TIGR02466 family)